uniref:Uncharacterized protein n=1 Tax=Human herpesvirus 2 TaxID=10310 RepID=A0A481TXB3_HHV2|nr:hypothetical protein [Human alphaherpesvirus 2]
MTAAALYGGAKYRPGTLRNPGRVASTPRRRGVLYGALCPGIPFVGSGPGAVGWECVWGGAFGATAARTKCIAAVPWGGPTGPLNICVCTGPASRTPEPTRGGSRLRP